MLAHHSKQMGQYICVVDSGIRAHLFWTFPSLFMIKDDWSQFDCTIVQSLLQFKSHSCQPSKISGNSTYPEMTPRTQYLFKLTTFPTNSLNVISPPKSHFSKSLIPNFHQTLYSTPNSILQEEVGGNVSLQWLHIPLLRIQNTTTADVTYDMRTNIPATNWSFTQRMNLSFTQRMHRCLYTNFIFNSRSSLSTSQSHW